MTVAAQIPQVSFLGNNTTSVFTFPYPLYLATDISIVVVGPTTSYKLVLNTDFSVAGLPITGAPPSTTATITLINAGQAWLSGGNLKTGYTMAVQRIMSLVQATSIRNQGDFYPETHENAFDYMTMLIQQLAMGGYIFSDLANGHTYQLVMINGQLSQVQLS